ncbi:2-iminobutanoate/2-iminopropanoate deaminase [Rhodobacter sp. 140A]|uniref:Putative aminoacrylate peracid reductase RutC n=1 Tax=bioreactor metagenome TaxID=1076179 RepID=A0A644VGS4_9ZZZZ|nr:2-iminobutanoate/2-iminopropanoate deaminase [Rhodobacter sp. 140A]
MDRTIIDVPVISAGLRRIGAPVSALVRSGGMLYTCGMPPIDLNSGEIVRGDITTQARAALEALAFALDFGGSSLSQTVKATVYLADNAFAAAMNAVYRDYFPDGFPARTCVAINTWPDFAIEIECIAPVLRPVDRAPDGTVQI